MPLVACCRCQNAPNSFCVGAQPRTPLGELTTLPRSLVGWRGDTLSCSAPAPNPSIMILHLVFVWCTTGILFCIYAICAYKNIHTHLYRAYININKCDSFCVVIYSTKFSESLTPAASRQASECTKLVFRRSPRPLWKSSWGSLRRPSRMGRGSETPRHHAHLLDTFGASFAPTYFSFPRACLYSHAAALVYKKCWPGSWQQQRVDHRRFFYPTVDM